MKKPAANVQPKNAAAPARADKAVESPVKKVSDGAANPSFLQRIFGIDLRSLALFRIAIGALLLVDLIARFGDFAAMYADDSMFPRSVISRYSNVWNWSFHFASGADTYQIALFGLAGILAFALLIGFETRIAVVGSWLMLVSLQHRVPPVLNGADTLLRMLLFWAMFLPLGRLWSADHWRAKRRNEAEGGSMQVVSIATAAILLQMALMYLFSAIFKSNADWKSGGVIAGVLTHSFYASPFGAQLLQFPKMLTALTLSTLVLEWVAPLLFFVPKFTASLRMFLIVALVGMHLGIDLCLEVGLFSWVSMAGLLLFLPKEFWQSKIVARLLRSAAQTQNISELKAKPATSSLWPQYTAQGVCGIALLYVLALNLNTLPSKPLAALAPEKSRMMTTGFGLGQRWGMFESVPSNDGWYVAKAKLKDGSEVDLLRAGAGVDWRRPEFPASHYPNHRWRKLFREMTYQDEFGFHVFRAPVAEFLCEQWNTQHPPAKQIAEFEFIFCTESKIGSPNISTPQVRRDQLVRLDLNKF